MKTIHIPEETFFALWVNQHQRAIEWAQEYLAPHKKTVSYEVETITDLALWFYKNNPGLISRTNGATDIEDKYLPQN